MLSLRVFLVHIYALCRAYECKVDAVTLSVTLLMSGVDVSARKYV